MSEEWMEELKRKQAHPHRLHVDVWHNEQGQVSIICLFVCLFDSILYVSSTIFQLNRDRSS